MTDYLYQVIFDVVIRADSEEKAQEIAEDIHISNMDVHVWSTEVDYRGIDEEGENE